MGDIADYYSNLAIEAEFYTPLEPNHWYMASGEPILIKEMTDSHLINSIKKIKRENWRLEYYPVLMEELSKRNSLETKECDATEIDIY